MRCQIDMFDDNNNILGSQNFSLEEFIILKNNGENIDYCISINSSKINMVIYVTSYQLDIIQHNYMYDIPTKIDINNACIVDTVVSIYDEEENGEDF